MGIKELFLITGITVIYLSLCWSIYTLMNIVVDNLKKYIKEVIQDVKTESKCINFDDDFTMTNKHTGWVNLYHEPSMQGDIECGSVYQTKKDAEEQIGNTEDYITTIKIEWEE